MKQIHIKRIQLSFYVFRIPMLSYVKTVTKQFYIDSGFSYN